MAGRLKGKVAVVTAAGQGIGRAIAEAFVAEGATVWATDKDVALLEGVARHRDGKVGARHVGQAALPAHEGRRPQVAGADGGTLKLHHGPFGSRTASNAFL